ncbi:RNA polymerase sigma factor [Streptomyces sp. Ru73]|uniref:RNA polymerase sigma factor n=1 Tax=Streptomyces sp. Ru73 TaxID=2080748 RepID=UPI0015E3BD3A|nr:sigma-70 family RNA polymerase sigma factor [Streptomyces sp. Ru73]
MSSRPGHPTQTAAEAPHAVRTERSRRPGRAGRAARSDRHDRHDLSLERYEPHVDGLFTYCLSVLCEHGAATEVLGEVLALAERQHGRRPSDPALYRPWLYALARWACLRRLADPDARPEPAAADETDQRRELAALAWPEAAGTTPEQREALELSVRHGLGSRELAAVLGMEPVAARALLSTAACEVERTRAALAVVEFGRCPDVARLAGDTRMLLGTALRRELVRHVDACEECRRTAERATAGGPWPGAEPVAQGPLPMVSAPRAAARVAMRAALRSRTGRAVEPLDKGAQGRTKRAGGVNGSAPRYDRSGFPLGPKDRAARNARLRSRALTTTVVATVVAAPVLALWAAYRGAPLTGETEGPAVTAGDSDADRLGSSEYEKAGSAQTTPDPGFSAGKRSPDVSVEVIGTHGERLREAAPSPSRSRSGPGRLTVAAQPSGDLTLVTLSASGGSAVRWAAHADAPWLQFSTTAGVLRPGESTTIKVYVDHDREPAGYWRARVTVDPAGAVVTIEGRGATRPDPGGPRPTPTDPPGHPTTPPPDPTPSDPSPSDPPPSSTPTPTPTEPSPSDPPPSSAPPPSDSGSPTG